MKYTTYYSNVEKVEYEFDQNDLLDILVKHLTKKPPYQDGGKWEIDYVDDYENKDDDYPSGWHIKLIHKIEQAVEKKDDKK
jgi:hypothetical protein